MHIPQQSFHQYVRHSIINIKLVPLPSNDCLQQLLVYLDYKKYWPQSRSLRNSVFHFQYIRYMVVRITSIKEVDFNKLKKQSLNPVS